MSSRNGYIPENVYDYILENTLRDRPELKALRDETQDLPLAMMQISPDQGQFMALLVKLTNAKRAIEVGTFTGYSALVVAEALPDDGKLVACDIDDEMPSIGQKHWEKNGLADKIDLRIGPAVETLDAMIEAGESGTYDIAFIDADKESYGEYYERCLALLRQRGLILIDNVLWGGRAADPSNTDESTIAIRELTTRMQADERVDFSLIPVGDGVSLAVKR
ncbi:MAG: SAM-dependent methyltransferase [Gemmatimonadetes bacterium]|mgnify:FL=1|nr:SAM-dependent methyltransferase [Gemmatimonadota bacterium]|tara:strand:- start:179 stop:841 length:663 start_codon:yes stop_codon:yes gene_type:complete